MVAFHSFEVLLYVLQQPADSLGKLWAHVAARGTPRWGDRGVSSPTEPAGLDRGGSTASTHMQA